MTDPTDAVLFSSLMFRKKHVPSRDQLCSFVLNFLAKIAMLTVVMLINRPFYAGSSARLFSWDQPSETVRETLFQVTQSEKSINENRPPLSSRAAAMFRQISHMDRCAPVWFRV